MSANPDSVANQGEFHDSRPGTNRKPHGEPLRRTLDREIGSAEHPVYHAHTFPPGTAPKEHSFSPNPISEIPGQALNPNMDPSLRTGPLDMPGATSKSVYNQEDTTAGGRPVEGIPKRVIDPAQTSQKKFSQLEAERSAEEKKKESEASGGHGYSPASVEEIEEESMTFKFSRV